MLKRNLFYYTALMAFGLDVLSKFLIVRNFRLGEQLRFGSLFSLTYVENPGAAFSMLAEASAAFRIPFFTLMTLLALTAIWFFRKKEVKFRDYLSHLALGLICGGAVGNLLDRLRLGRVIDFLDVNIPLGVVAEPLGLHGFFSALASRLGQFFPDYYDFPIFNVADSAVFMGVVLILWRMLRPYEDIQQNPDGPVKVSE